jgi:hypothetical protein
MEEKTKTPPASKPGGHASSLAAPITGRQVKGRFLPGAKSEKGLAVSVLVGGLLVGPPSFRQKQNKTFFFTRRALALRWRVVRGVQGAPKRKLGGLKATQSHNDFERSC